MFCKVWLIIDGSQLPLDELQIFDVLVFDQNHARFDYVFEIHDFQLDLLAVRDLAESHEKGSVRISDRANLVHRLGNPEEAWLVQNRHSWLQLDHLGIQGQ